MSTHDPDGPTAAMLHATAGAQAWRNVVHTLPTDHTDWYAVTGDLVDTLHCLASLAGLLERQVTGYAEGRVLRDDQPGRAPADRLVAAAEWAKRLRGDLDLAGHSANRFWNEISHIAVEEVSR